MPTPTQNHPNPGLFQRLALRLLGARWEPRLECGPSGEIMTTWYLVRPGTTMEDAANLRSRDDLAGCPPKVKLAKSLVSYRNATPEVIEAANTAMARYLSGSP